MIRRMILHRRCYLATMIPFYGQRNVIDEIETYEPPPPPQNGWERIKLLFHQDHLGNVSKEYLACIHYTVGGACLGFLLGGFLKSVAHTKKYIQENQSTKYISVYEARRKLSDQSTLSFMNGGTKYGLKFGLLTFVFSFSVMIISAYRNEKGILEYIIGGALGAGLFQMYLGIKAFLASTVIGGLLGGIIGSIIYLSVKLTGTTIEETEQWHYDMKVRKDEMRKDFKKKIYDLGKTNRHWSAHEGLSGKVGYSLSDDDFAYIKVDESEINANTGSEMTKNENLSSEKNSTSENAVVKS